MKKILLIEDDPDLREIISQYLTRDGYDVMTADGIESATTLINAEIDFSAAIVDFWLGSESTVDLLDVISNRLPETPMLMISGGGGNMSIEKTQLIGEISGAVTFLQKPFRKVELISALETVMDKS